MKATLLVFVSILLGCTLRGADKRYTRAEALAQLQSAGRNSQVVFVAKLEMRNGKRVLVCLDVIKSSKGLPAAGELLSLDAAIPVGREGIVFMPAYPSPGFSGEIRWLRDGNLNECRELSLTEIKGALRKEAAEAPLAVGAKS